MRLTSDRLIVEQVDETARPEEFLQIFNSHLDFIEASEAATGKCAYDLADVEKYLWLETSRENSRCLAQRWRVTNELVGTATFVAPHTNEPFPWIGLLLIDGAWQSQSLGAEAARVIEGQLAQEGWTEIRLGVLRANPRARRFWERQGYTVYDERVDDNQRPIWLMHKRVQGGAQ